MERVMGIEPTLAAWEAAVLPLNYTRNTLIIFSNCCHRRLTAMAGTYGMAATGTL
jgi:hypothetical protein